MRCLRNNPEVQHVSLGVKGHWGAWTAKEREPGDALSSVPSARHQEQFKI